MIIGYRGGWWRRIGGCHDEINMDGRLNTLEELVNTVTARAMRESQKMQCSNYF